MLDIKFLRSNPEIVKQNIKNKFQDEKLPLVDEVIELDEKSRSVKCKGDELRAQRNSLSDQIGNLMRNGQKEEAESVKEQVKEINQKLVEYILKNEKDGVFIFDRSIKDLAEYFNVSRPSLSRVIKKFIEDKVIEKLEKGKYKILSKEKLIIIQ